MTCLFWDRCLKRSGKGALCSTNGKGCPAYAAIDKIENIDKAKPLTCTL